MEPVGKTSPTNGAHQSLQTLLATNRPEARRWLNLRISTPVHQRNTARQSSKKVIFQNSRLRRANPSTRAIKT
jgi:hypothetical protein